MKRFSSFLAPAALIVPVLAVGVALQVEAQDARPDRPGQQRILPVAFPPAAEAPFDTLEAARDPEPAQQVRIRRRVTIRIGPAAPQARAQMMADLPRRPMRARYQEVDHDDCIENQEVLGIQPTPDNRLLFYSARRQILVAALEDGCSARAFYAGFYVEPHEDGRICINRDRLQSRAGASCQVSDFTRVVAAAD